MFYTSEAAILNIQDGCHLNDFFVEIIRLGMLVNMDLDTKNMSLHGPEMVSNGNKQVSGSHFENLRWPPC